MQDSLPLHKYSHVYTHDIKITIGNILINILLDSSFFVDTNPYTFSKHSHPLYELFIVTQGSSTLYYGNKCVDVSKEDILLISPHVYHVLKDSSVKIRCFCFSFDFLTKKASHRHREHLEYTIRQLSDTEVLVLKDNFSVIEILSEISDELNRGDYGYNEMVQSYFTKFFILLIRETARINQVVKAERMDISRNLNDEIMRAEVIDVFFGNISIMDSFENINIETLAKVLKLSVSQTHRVLKKLYNMSFQEKLTQTRMQMAGHLLQNHDIKNAAIAEMLGYQTESSYYRSFKKYYGCTPNQYRHMKQKD